MINFRYHLASLIAVFLALGLGIVAGSTFVSPETVRALQRTLRSIDAKDKALEDQNNALNQSISGLLAYASATRDLLVQGKLAGRPVVLLSFDTTTSGEASQVATTLVQAGCKLQGSIVLSSRLALPDDASRQQVAAVVGGAATADAVQAALTHQLGDAPLTASSLAVPGSVVVTLSPAEPQPGAKPPPDLGKAVIEPLIRALSAASVTLAVGEDGSSSLPVLSSIRGDSSLKVVTVDSVDQPMGQAALVLGLSEALRDHVWGAYGFGSGASAPLPTPQPNPSGSAPASATVTVGPSPVSNRR